MRNRFDRLVVLAAILTLLVGCSAGSQQSPRQPSPQQEVQAPEPSREKAEIVVAAAQSLQKALTEAKEVFERANSHIEVTFNFASSGVLQQQIEQGAAIDVFVSAATKNMDDLVAKGLVDEGAVRRFVSNAMVLIRNKEGSDVVRGWEDLTKARLVAMGNPAHTPIGKGAVQVMEKLGIWDEVQDHVVLGETVGQVLNYVEAGEVDAGIVFATDALSSAKVTVVAEAPAGSHDPFIYPIAVLKQSKQPEAASAFVDFLTSKQGKAIMTKHGFKD